jgi:hypothetical protein
MIQMKMAELSLSRGCRRAYGSGELPSRVTA